MVSANSRTVLLNSCLLITKTLKLSPAVPAHLTFEQGYLKPALLHYSNVVTKVDAHVMIIFS